MTGPRPDVRLVQLTEQHLPAMDLVVNDPEVARFTRFPAPAPADFVSQWYERYLAGRADGSREAFAVLSDPSTGSRFLGVALAPNIDVEGQEMELGYLVVPAERGRGVASELLRQLTDWAFDAGNALRVSLIIDVDNPASLRAAARAGYRREGLLRSTYFKQGMRTDVELWARLASDPAPS